MKLGRFLQELVINIHMLVACLLKYPMDDKKSEDDAIIL